MDNPTLRVIRQRRSIRSFKDEKIKDEELKAIVEAGNYAPYAEEGSRYITVIQNKNLLHKLNSIAKEVAQTMALEGLRKLGRDENFHSLYGAPTLLIISGREQSVSPEADCAAATQNILLAAESMEIGSCWIFFDLLAFFSPQGAELRSELKIPAGFKPYTSVALGYKNSREDDMPDRNLSNVTFVR
ncbi:nitroreductase family protein [Desulfosporosinus sp. PR]|uniref:nitroreductase family protein n=1 Tax=Candidatus Desulfosporosinus nitrosoreducens TaxID=3401928 RepID=UPI0027F288DE|nr:nitroreductase family protein [Desulfosporosinus sp. PR]MDQ7097075.1 nitroreductase family protein [Desulfosporosinus sp. PR]